MGIRVLVAEDDSSVRDMLSLALSFEDDIERLCFASDGAMAAELCNELEPHVLITDSLLPKMSGVDVAKYCRQINPRVHVISFSGLDVRVGEWPDQVIPKGDPDALGKLKNALQDVRERVFSATITEEAGDASSPSS